MRLHNTLAKQVDELRPLQPPAVSLYSCGPTVYDHIHIGNLSSFIFADTLRRTLAGSGLRVTHVMNFTDIDDKTVRRSREQYPELEPMAALLKLTAEYADIFRQDMAAVGNDVAAMTFVKATDSITAMQQLITELHQKGFAYVADDGVYFSIEAYQKSGKKYGQLSEVTASSTAQARIQNDEYDKAAAHDFALWKSRKPGEPAWEFQLAGQDLTGRPGWHVECSAMSRAALGQPFDIHTGGVDLIFPHHENEIAQSTAGNDQAYAAVFAHNEHLLVDGQKMSKSLHNFYTLADVQAKGYQPLAFRLLVLQAHYRTQAHFSWDNLAAAQNRLQGYRAMADRYWQPQAAGGLAEATIKGYQQTITEALQDDLNTPKALATLSMLADELETAGLGVASQPAFGAALEWLDQALGLQLNGEDITSQQKTVIAEREAARAAKDWATSDTLRDQLLAQHISLKDLPDRTIWSRI